MRICCYFSIMNILLNDFKQYCHDTFSPKNGDYVYQFYRNTIEIDNKSGCAIYVNGRKKSTYESSNDRKMKHLQSCVDRFEKEYIIKSCQNFQEKLDMGLVASKSINYFEGFIKNQYQDYLNKNSIAAPVRTNNTDTKKVKPVPYDKPWDHFTGENNWKNWFYLCPDCKEILHHYPNTCPKCNVIIDWESIIIDFQKGLFL